MIHFFKKILFASLLSLMSLDAVETEPVEPVVILGGGVGSLSSAIYLGRAGLSPLVIEGPTPGGLLTQSHTVQNWPGVMEIDGADLTEKMREQAKASGARFVKEEVVAVDFSKRPFTIVTKSLDGRGNTRSITTEACIIAMGTKPNFLGIRGEQEFWGKGVTNCAICDGNLFKDKVVGVVGGGDAAVLEALYLSNIAKKVHVFVRKGSLKAIEERRVQALKKKENVIFHYGTQVDEIVGNANGLESVVLKRKNQRSSFKLDGLFLAIGSTPNSIIFKNQLTLDEKGYIALKEDQQTSIQGVYAIGDIVDPIYKQAVSAAGDGAKAALQAQQYLSDRSHLLITKAQPVQEVRETVLTQEVIEVLSLEQFQQEVSSSQTPVVVDFYATWCGPCKRIAPVLTNSANELAGKVKFLKVDVDKMSNLTNSYNIRSMPTVLLLDPSGEELDRKVGTDQIESLLQSLKK